MLDIATIGEDDGSDRELLQRRRERARAVRERQDARLLDHLSEVIVDKYIARKNLPLYVKATRTVATQTARDAENKESQTLTPPLPAHSWDRAPPWADAPPPADPSCKAQPRPPVPDFPVATVARGPWEDVDLTGNTRSFWFHPERRLELIKSPKPPLRRGDPRRQRTRYETDVSRDELKTYSVQNSARYGQLTKKWFRDGDPALYAAKSGYWRPGCIIPSSDGTAIFWDCPRGNAKVNFYFARCGNTHSVRFDHCTSYFASQCDEPHGL